MHKTPPRGTQRKNPCKGSTPRTSNRPRVSALKNTHLKPSCHRTGTTTTVTHPQPECDLRHHIILPPPPRAGFNKTSKSKHSHTKRNVCVCACVCVCERECLCVCVCASVRACAQCVPHSISSSRFSRASFYISISQGFICSTKQCRNADID